MYLFCGYLIKSKMIMGFQNTAYSWLRGESIVSTMLWRKKHWFLIPYVRMPSKILYKSQISDWNPDYVWNFYINNYQSMERCKQMTSLFLKTVVS